MIKICMDDMLFEAVDYYARRAPRLCYERVLLPYPVGYNDVAYHGMRDPETGVCYVGYTDYYLVCAPDEYAIEKEATK